MNKKEHQIKCLKFAEPLPGLILRGEKDTTWRVNDNKNLTQGDKISLQRTNRTEFARAKITAIKTTTFGELTKEDKHGHEKFNSNEEMLQTYSCYYNENINMNTSLKVIKFKLK